MYERVPLDFWALSTTQQISLILVDIQRNDSATAIYALDIRAP